MEHYLWLFNNQNDRRGLWGACLFSLLLHVIMFAIMATTTIFYPMTGENSKLDVVWLYPSFLMGGDAEPVSALPAAPRQERALPDSSEQQHPRKNEEIRPEPQGEAVLSQKAKSAPAPAPAVEEDAGTNPEIAPTAPQDSPSEDEPEMVLPPVTSLQRVAAAAAKPSKTEPGADKSSPRESPAPANNIKAAVKEKAAPLNTGEVQSAEPEKPVTIPATSRPEPVRNVIAAREIPQKGEMPRVTERKEPARPPTPLLQAPAGGNGASHVVSCFCRIGAVRYNTIGGLWRATVFDHPDRRDDGGADAERAGRRHRSDERCRVQCPCQRDGENLEHAGRQRHGRPDSRRGRVEALAAALRDRPASAAHHRYRPTRHCGRPNRPTCIT